MEERILESSRNINLNGPVYFASADDRIEAALFSLLVFFPAPKVALVCLPSRDPRPYGACSVCGYVLLVLLRDEAVPRN